MYKYIRLLYIFIYIDTQTKLNQWEFKIPSEWHNLELVKLSYSLSLKLSIVISKF